MEGKGRQELGSGSVAQKQKADEGKDFNENFLLYFLHTHIDDSKVMRIKTDARISQILLMGLVI